MEKTGYVYIMANWTGSVLYVGVTNDVKRRAFEHRSMLCEGFTWKYEVKKLVYYEDCGSIEQAILREKQIKGGPRWRKEALVNGLNPEWLDLYDGI